MVLVARPIISATLTFLGTRCIRCQCPTFLGSDLLPASVPGSTLVSPMSPEKARPAAHNGRQGPCVAPVPSHGFTLRRKQKGDHGISQKRQSSC
jgi:hypothetical protein